MPSSQPADLTATPEAMLHALAENWWLTLLRGVLAILFGVLTIFWPGATIIMLATLYGAFVLFDGILALAAAIRGGSPAPRWWLVVVGLAGLVAGIAAFLFPGMTALMLLYFIAAWAIATGIMQVVGAIQLRKQIDNEWSLILNGALSVIFGVVLVIVPGAGALALATILGIYAIVFGVLLVSLSLRLRQHQLHPS